MADNDQNSGDLGDSILWGLSFGLASALAFKTIGALFPQGNTKEKYEDETYKVAQINIPIDVTINKPTNIPHENNISQNYQSKPKPILGHEVVSCEKLMSDLLYDCKSERGNKCDSYSKIYKKFCSESGLAAISTADIGSSLLFDSFYGCMKGSYLSDNQKACKEKYKKLMQIR